MYVLLNGKGTVVHTTKKIEEAEKLQKLGLFATRVDTEDKRMAEILAQMEFLNSIEGEWHRIH